MQKLKHTSRSEISSIRDIEPEKITNEIIFEIAEKEMRRLFELDGFTHGTDAKNPYATKKIELENLSLTLIQYAGGSLKIEIRNESDDIERSLFANYPLTRDQRYLQFSRGVISSIRNRTQILSGPESIKSYKEMRTKQIVCNFSSDLQGKYFFCDYDKDGEFHRIPITSDILEEIRSILQETEDHILEDKRLLASIMDNARNRYESAMS